MAYYAVALIAVVVAWSKGGRPERLGVIATVVLFTVAWFTHTWRIGTFYAGDTLTDLGLTVFFGWLALSTDRWWPLAMTAVMVLIMLVHVASIAFPEMSAYANVSARIGLGILSSLVLLAGAFERWLAGETANRDRTTRKWPRWRKELGNGHRLS